MQFRPSDIVGLGGLFIMALVAMKKRKLLSLVLGLTFVAWLLACFFSKDESPLNSAKANASGANSTAASTTGDASPVLITSPGAVVKNNSDNPDVNVSGNTGNLVVQIGGSNNSVTQSITQLVTNRTPQPFIVQSKLISTNVLEGGSYKSKLFVLIGNAPTNFKLHFGFPPQILISKPEDDHVGTGMAISPKFGNVNSQTHIITFTTSQKVKESDFNCSVEAIP